MSFVTITIPNLSQSQELIYQDDIDKCLSDVYTAK